MLTRCMPVSASERTIIDVLCSRNRPVGLQLRGRSALLSPSAFLNSETGSVVDLGVLLLSHGTCGTHHARITFGQRTSCDATDTDWPLVLCR